MLTVVLILRWVSFVTACYNVNWSIRGASLLFRGSWTPPSIYLSVVFLFSACVMAFWGGWARSPHRALEVDQVVTAWRLLAYTLCTLGMLLAAIGHRMGAAMKARRFYSLYDHLEEAFAMSELARVDPTAADRVAGECRRLTAEAVLGGEGVTVMEAVPLIGASGFAGWAGKALLAWLTNRGAADKAKIDGEVTLKQHTDKLMFDVLTAAKQQVETLTARVAELQPLVGEAAHLSEALDHIAALLASDTSEERKAAERRATAFLNRMRRLAEAKGTILNEMQREQSAAALPPDIQEKLGRMP